VITMDASSFKALKFVLEVKSWRPG
jgi:hypothetical protein